MYTANHDDAKKRPGSRTLGPWKQRDVLDGSRVSNGVGRGEIRRKFYLFTTNKLKKEKRRQGKRKEKRTEKQTSSFRWYRVWYWVWIPFGHSRNISGKRINLELKKKKPLPGSPRESVYISIYYMHTRICGLARREEVLGFLGSILVLSCPFFLFVSFFLGRWYMLFVSRLLLLVLLSYYLGFSKLKAIPIPI